MRTRRDLRSLARARLRRLRCELRFATLKQRAARRWHVASKRPVTLLCGEKKHDDEYLFVCVSLHFERVSLNLGASSKVSSELIMARN